MPPAEKFGTGSLPCLCHPLNQVERNAQLLGLVHEFFLADRGEALHLLDDGAHVANRFNDISRAGFALGANHRGAFGDAA